MTAILWLAFFSIIHVTAAGNICRIDCKVQFVTRGCYRDKGGKSRALPNYIYNERDPRVKKNYGGRRIDWHNWDEYYPGFACRCAEVAKAQGYDLFGVQFYGECWAGHSGLHKYDKYGVDTKGCIEDSFSTCTPYSRYCAGKRWRNMVYQIVDATCPKINFERVGCFRDKHKPPRPLPDYLFNDRDPSIDNFSGKRIDWRAWDVYLPEFACRCAEAAKKANHTFFGVQFYGECWSGKDSHLTYDIDGPQQGGCINQCYEPCAINNKFCAGRNFENFVYRIVDGSCEVDISPVGCYKENATIPALGEIFHNEAAPDKPNFAGNMIQSVDNYEAYFPDFLCKCARKARENGLEYFGVRELGLCVRGYTPSDFAQHGPSQQCFVGNSSIACPNGSKLCSGLNAEANYVYKVTLSGVTPKRDMAQDIPDERPKADIPPQTVVRSRSHPKTNARSFGKTLL